MKYTCILFALVRLSDFKDRRGDSVLFSSNKRKYIIWSNSSTLSRRGLCDSSCLRLRRISHCHLDNVVQFSCDYPSLSSLLWVIVTIISDTLVISVIIYRSWCLDSEGESMQKKSSYWLLQSVVEMTWLLPCVPLDFWLKFLFTAEKQPLKWLKHISSFIKYLCKQKYLRT